MANGNPINNLEHNNLSPVEYSIPQEIALYSFLTAQQKASFAEQSYLRTYYDEYNYTDYAGAVFIMPPNPIILPKINVYNGIAPLDGQPQIDPPYPWQTYFQ